MSYLLDKKQRRKNFLRISVLVFFIIVFFYFRIDIFRGLSLVGHFFFRPVLVLQNNVGQTFSNWSSLLKLKSSLLNENEKLKLQLAEKEILLMDRNFLLAENIRIKEILDRKEEKEEMILASILAKPNQSPYDTLIIDVGKNNGAQEGSLVFALGNVPIGKIVSVYSNSSKVVLFSGNKEKTQVIVEGRNVFMEIIGRGGGNFEMILPRDFILEEGSIVTLPGPFSYIVAKTETIISDPRDSFQRALLVSPVNIQELKFVEVRK